MSSAAFLEVARDLTMCCAAANTLSLPRTATVPSATSLSSCRRARELADPNRDGAPPRSSLCRREAPRDAAAQPLLLPPRPASAPVVRLAAAVAYSLAVQGRRIGSRGSAGAAHRGWRHAPPRASIDEHGRVVGPPARAARWAPPRAYTRASTGEHGRLHAPRRRALPSRTAARHGQLVVYDMRVPVVRKKNGSPRWFRGGRGRTNAREHDPNRQKRTEKVS